MTFMASLAENPSGSSIYGQSGQGDSGEGTALDLVNRLKDREMRDFKDKANFMSDLSLKQDRIRRLFQPETGPTGPEGLASNLPGSVRMGYTEGQGVQPMNTVMGHDPNEIGPLQKADLGIRQQGLNLESQRIAQTGKLGEQSLGIRQQQADLAQQKSDQINANKTADLERKIEEHKQTIKLAEERIKQAGDNFEARTKAMQEHQSAVEAYHKAEMERKQHEFDVTNENHKRTIAAMEKRLSQQGKTKTTVTQGGETRTTTTERGDEPPAGRVWGIGRDGNRYPVPIDKIDDWNQNHAQPGSEIKKPGGEEE